MMTLHFICKVATDNLVLKLVIFFLIGYICSKPVSSITRMSAVEWHDYLDIMYEYINVNHMIYKIVFFEFLFIVELE